MSGRQADAKTRLTPRGRPRVIGSGILVVMLMVLGLPPSIPVAAAGGSSSAVPGALTNETLIAVADAARASVVSVVSVRKVQAGEEEVPNPLFEDPFFRKFFGEEFQRRFPPPGEQREQGLGSGVIVSADGSIVTNHHVVEGAEAMTVILPDGRRFKATLTGADSKTDVAVLKIHATGLPVLPWADSSRLRVGEVVLAFGSPFGLSQTITMGIISAVGRAHVGIVDYEDFIQTDAAVNPGNSGGALVNLQGELVGINTAIFSQSGGYMGIGFAIPSNMARNVMESLVKHGKVIRGWLGVAIQDVTGDLAKEFGVPEAKGALVSEVSEGSPADKAGLARGDVITAFNDRPIKDSTQLRALVSEAAPGTAGTLTILRDKRVQTLTVTLAEQPKEVGARPSKPSVSGRGAHALAGVAVEPLAKEDARRLKLEGGVVVSEVRPDSPADQAGLRPGDIIREVNRHPVRTVAGWERLVSQLTPKSRVLLLITRGAATGFLSITPEG